MKKLIVASTAFAALLLIAFGSMTQQADARSKKTPPSGYSGGPGDGPGGRTCWTGCHNNYSQAFNKSGWITSDIPVTGYVPGATYNITIHNNSKGYRHGFEASCQTNAGVFQGTLIGNDSTQVIVDPTVTSKQWIAQMDSMRALSMVPPVSTSLGYHGNGNASVTFNTKAWTFKWVAPSAGTGDVTFYMATVATNNNNDDHAAPYQQTSWAGDSVFSSTLPLFENTTLSIGSVTKPCNGNNGSATVNATYGTAPYTYSWNSSPVQTTQTATNLGAGTYTVVVTDALSSVKTLTFTLQNKIKAIINDQNIPVCNNGTITHTVVPIGTGPFTYLWAPSGGTAAISTALAAGTYSVTVTDAATCATTLTVTTTNNPPMHIWFFDWQDSAVTRNGGANGYAKIQREFAPSGSVYTYAWNPAIGIQGQFQDSLTAQTYTCTVTNTHSVCPTQVVAATVTITQPTVLTASVTASNNGCNSANNGTATVTAAGGTPPYTYLWSNGQTSATATGLAPGTYTCTVTHRGVYATSQDVPALQRAVSAVGSWSVTATVTISALSASIAPPTNPTCFGGTGSATVTPVGGTAPYTYLWSPSGGTVATATGLAAGSYTCTITDANGCVVSANRTLVQPGALLGSASTVSPLCNGDNNGSATVVAGGGTPTYTYLWAPSGATTATSSGLVAGSYTCTITDAYGCTTAVNTTVAEPGVLVGSGSTVSPLCNGGNGTATVYAGGGNPLYTYLWAPSGGTAATTTAVPAATYTCTITDANGCTTTVSNTINEPAALTTLMGTTSEYFAANGTATAYPSGGTAPYSFLWAPTGGTAQVASGLVAGTYSVTVTDVNGCTVTNSVVVTSVVGVSSIDADNSINVFPNPNSGEFDMVLNATENTNYTIVLTNVLGQVVYTETLENFSGNYTKHFDVNSNGKGVYLMSVRSANHQVVRKIVVY